MAALMFAVHRSGHWWGDDWALYIRQAQALLDGEPGRVLTENRATVELSQGPPFSPPLYPWGFPLLLAPFVAIVGDDVDRLAVQPVLCACVFAIAWFALARPRLGRLPALVGMVAATITPVLLGWTELIQSEWTFMAVTAVVLVGLDRLAATSVFVHPRGAITPLILIGVGAAASFSVRREGLAVLVAIGAAQVGVLIGEQIRPWRPSGQSTWHLLTRLATPYAAALGTIGLMQVLLPSTIVPSYDNTTVANSWRSIEKHLHNIAQLAGLQRPGRADPSVFGNVTIGWLVVSLYLTIAVGGILWAIVTLRRRDLHLAVYAVVAFVIGTSPQATLNRYIATVVPVLLLLGLIVVFDVSNHLGGVRTATIATTSLLAMLAVSNLEYGWVRAEQARAFADAGQVEWGAQHPEAIAMFGAVDDFTRPGDLIAAPKARAMAKETGRPTVQVDDARGIPPSLDIALVVVERNADLADELRAEPESYTIVWENNRFTIFRPVAHDTGD